MMKKILSVIGARPQFIKHAPLEKVLMKEFLTVSIHTGQHYDKEMSEIFFTQLGIKAPDYLLQTGGGLHGEQTGKMLIELEPIVLKEKPVAVLVYGDTNSTLAGALVAAKLNIPIIHIEAGLRSFNRSMPEEINRVLTDHLSHILIAPSERAVQNLAREGITLNVFKTGDVMCDLLLWTVNNIEFTKEAEPFYYATIHRPYNTDEKTRLLEVLNALNNLENKVKFPAHPRTYHKMKEWGIGEAQFPNIHFMQPVSYFDNVRYLSQSEALITDSGGMQKEAYILKKKCITIRSETEWTETLQGGWNTLVFEDLTRLSNIVENQPEDYVENLYGNGDAAEEIVFIIKKLL